MDIYKHISIDENSRIPKYQQIVDAVTANIANGNFGIDLKMPSINRFSEEYYLSRDTVEKAYGILKDRNIIASIRGKGFYISSTQLLAKKRILFLVNKLSNYKLKTYNHFIENIGANCHTDLHVYHCDETLFLNLIDKHKSSYDYYVIMSHFKTDELKHVSYTPKTLEALSKIPQNKLVFLDNVKQNFEGAFGEVYQDFEEDIYNALTEGLSKIKKYKKVILVYAEKSLYPYPRRILHGFRKFCVSNSLDFEVIEKVFDNMILKEGDLFITIDETDLVNLIKQAKEDEYALGKDIGIISYNDTPLKGLLGVTVMSTDFKDMGEKTADIILNKTELTSIKVPFKFIERDSL